MSWASKGELDFLRLEEKEVILYRETAYSPQLRCMCPGFPCLLHCFTVPVSTLGGSRMAHAHHWFSIDGRTLPHQSLSFGLSAGKVGHLFCQTLPSECLWCQGLLLSRLTYLVFQKATYFSPSCCVKHSLFLSPPFLFSAGLFAFRRTLSRGADL